MSGQGIARTLLPALAGGCLALAIFGLLTVITDTWFGARVLQTEWLFGSKRALVLSLAGFAFSAVLTYLPAFLLIFAFAALRSARVGRPGSAGIAGVLIVLGGFVMYSSGLPLITCLALVVAGFGGLACVLALSRPRSRSDAHA